MHIEIRKVFESEFAELSRMDLLIFDSDAFTDPKEWVGLECFWLIVDGHRIGSIAMKHNSAISNSYDDEYPHVIGSLYLVSIGILSDMRRRGFASLLMAYLFAYARANSFQKICSNVRASNEASINLHKKFRFEVTRFIADYYENPRQDAIVLEASLK